MCVSLLVVLKDSSPWGAHRFAVLLCNCHAILCMYFLVVHMIRCIKLFSKNCTFPEDLFKFLDFNLKKAKKFF